MAEYKLASLDDIAIEKERYRQWLIETGKGNAQNYPSLWARIDSIFVELGYSDSILGRIVGRVNAKQYKDAAGLVLIVRDQLKIYYKEKDPEKKCWNDVATSLRMYALDFLLQGKKTDEDELKKRIDARKLAVDVALLFESSKIRSVLKGRLMSQDRKVQKDDGIFFPQKEINSALSENLQYQQFKNELADDIVFWAYDPMEDPDFHCQKAIKFKDLAKMHFDTSGRVSIRKKGDSVTYILLTPTFPGELWRPASAKSIDELEVDHEPAIADELKKLKSRLPLLDSISNDKKSGRTPDFSIIDQAALIEELRLLHDGIDLRMMEKDENRKKSNK